MKKNKTFKFPKKFDIVMSAQMPVRFGKTSRMLNNLLQNYDTVVFYDPATSFSSLCQKISRGLVV